MNSSQLKIITNKLYLSIKPTAKLLNIQNNKIN